MALVLYFVSSIGLGHATRSVALAEQLRKKGIGVVFCSAGKARELLASYQYDTLDFVQEPKPTVLAGRMVLPSLWYVRYWLKYREGKETAKKIINKYKPDIVVSDEEFSSASFCIENGIKNVIITDETRLSFARSLVSRKIEQRVREWYTNLLSKADVVVIPDIGKDEGNVKFIGPVVRRCNLTRQQIRKKYSLPEDKKIILFSLSGSGIGGFVLNKVMGYVQQRDDTLLVVTGGKRRKKNNERILELGFVRDNHELVYASDIVISTAGKSTIDESSAYGTPIIAIPIKWHSEQESNALSLGYSFKDIERINDIIDQKIGKRYEVSIPNGDYLFSEIVCSLL